MTNKSVFSLINYIGHKSKIADTIISLFPKEIEGTFWDVFSGSCVIGLSSNFKNVNFVDNNLHLQNLYRNLQNENFIKTIETLIKKYGLTNSSIVPRSEYLKLPNIGTCTWKGKTVPNMHLDGLNKKGYDLILEDYKNNKFKDLEKACAYMILTIYGRNSNVSVKKDGTVSGSVGPLDFSPRAKKKYYQHIELMKNRNLNWIDEDFKNCTPSENDFVYLDPPYLASSFKYSGWSEEDEISLLNWIDNLKCPWALSNVFTSGKNNNKILFNWAQKYNVLEIDKNYRKWAIKGKSTQDRKVKKNTEVLIKNY